MNHVSRTNTNRQRIAQRSQTAAFRRDANGRYHFYATGRNDRIRVLKRGDRVVVRINDQQLELTRKEAQSMTIHAGAGDDNVYLDPGLPKDIAVRCGRGNDNVVARHSDAVIYGGAGHDWMVSSADGPLFEGGAGKDRQTVVADMNRPLNIGRDGRAVCSNRRTGQPHHSHRRRAQRRKSKLEVLRDRLRARARRRRRKRPLWRRVLRQLRRPAHRNETMRT
jgi:Ca2+-binding RTX toxin-like protein